MNWKFAHFVSSIWVVALAATVLWTMAAWAHDRTHSYSSWRFDGAEVHVTARLAELDTTHFEWGLYPPSVRDLELARYLVEHLQLVAGDEPCTVVEPPRCTHPGAGRLAVTWSLRCPEWRALRLRSDVLFDVVPSHLHFVRIEGLSGAPQERVLTAAQREWLLPGSAHEYEQPPSGFFPYVLLGLEHIATGYDHLAFVLALVLIGGSLGSLAKIVTAFTLAHSVTLACSVLGWIRPQSNAVEALIGFSIAMVATENLWLRAGRQWRGPWVLAVALVAVAVLAAAGVGRVPPLVATGLALFVVSFFALVRDLPRADAVRWSVAFLFGLVHGFGFASVLLDVGLGTGDLAKALLGFNLGVEVGQLAVVVAVWPALQWLKRAWPELSGAVVEVTSTMVLALGTYWFFVRAFG